MKNILLSILVFSTISVCCQTSTEDHSCVDTVRKSGFVFEIFSENALRHAKKKKRKLKRKGVMELEIDNIRRFFFVESDSTINGADLADRMQHILAPVGTEIFTFCPYQWELNQTICGKSSGARKNNCEFPKLESERYFRIKGVRRKLFKLFFITADWQLFTVPTKHSPLYVSSTFPTNGLDPGKKYFSLHYAINVVALDLSLEFNDVISIEK